MVITVVLMGACAFWALGGTVEKATDMLRFIVTVRFVEEKFVGDIPPGALINGSFDGMMQALNDKYSVYMDPEKFKQLNSINHGSFGGIGVVMSFSEPGHCRIMSVMDGAPGKEAGLEPNDEIIAVEGIAVDTLQPEEIVSQIRGEEGTSVVLTVRRAGQEDQDYTLVRSNIHVDTAAGDVLPNTDIGYIRIASFSENTAVEFQNVLTTLKEKNIKGLIIDLRANPGGLLKTCVEIANMVVPAGDVVSVVDHSGYKEVYRSELQGEFLPIVVLIDNNSASASEILAGALKDRKAATLVGVKSYGKGSVQTILPLFKGDGIKLTVAKYYTPSGVSIDGVGIEPDVEIALPEKPVKDVQLEKAIEVMNKKLNN
ncbi:MAG: S41 family peptidase [Anaerovibrio sp.]|nr:S41 family peptidase [Anaerovibrio sp.]